MWFGILLLALAAIYLLAAWRSAVRRRARNRREGYGKDFDRLSPAEQGKRRRQREELLRKYGRDYFSLSQEEQAKRRELYAWIQFGLSMKEAGKKSGSSDSARPHQPPESIRLSKWEMEAQEAARIQKRIDQGNRRSAQERARKTAACPACYPSLCADCPRDKRGLPCLMEKE